MSLPMQKAKYTAQAFAVSFGLSSNGNTQIGVSFDIETPFAGETIAWIGHFTDKTAERTIESLQHAGWKGDDLSELDGLDEAGVRTVLPNAVELVCDVERYEGEDRLRVQWVNRLGGGRFAFKEQIEGAALKSFAAQMRATVRGVRGAGGAPRLARASVPTHSSAAMPASAEHPNAPGGPRDREDIPF